MLSTPFWEFQLYEARDRLAKIIVIDALSTPFWEFPLYPILTSPLRISTLSLSTPFWEFPSPPKHSSSLRKRKPHLLSTPFWEFL